MATFADKYGAKYDRVVVCLIEDRDALLAFYDFLRRTLGPPAHVQSHRERVRDRPAPHGALPRGALSQNTARLMVFKLITTAARTWRRLKRGNQLPEVVQGVTFRNGVEVTNTPDQNAA